MCTEKPDLLLDIFTCVPEMSLETTHLSKLRKKKRVRGRKEKERESETRRSKG